MGPPPAATASHTSSVPEALKTVVVADTVSNECFPLDAVILPTDWALSDREMCDLELLLNGAFSPLTGYLSFPDYLSVVNNMRLTTGEVWPIPIVLSIPKSATKPNIHWLRETCEMDKQTTEEQVVMLRDKVGTIVAELRVTDLYEPHLDLEMEKVLGTKDPNHPYVSYMLRNHRDCYYVGGEITAKTPIMHFDFEQYRKSPSAVKDMIKANGWKAIVGFQTRNPMHCSHYHLTMQAMKEVSESDGQKAHLLLTPTVGTTQDLDVEYHIRVRCYMKLLEHYPPGSVDMVILPLAMRMAGPREAVWHAIIRKNYGCTHFIVGRDHAGPSTKKQSGESFYGPYEAHNLLQTVKDELGIKAVFGKTMVYVGAAAGGYVEADAVPVGAKAENISGSDLRRKLQSQGDIPEWFSFPNVVEVLHQFFLPRHRRGLCIYFTGLPCSGKSTLANALEAALLENKFETRRVTVFDADVVRTHLSKGLGFSKEDRSINVRRIGFLASEVVKHGGVCLVSNIAPYEEDRRYNRELISKDDEGYVEVYVSTPIDVCEKRDVKRLYKLARQGVIKHFTGISDPYQVPTNSELVVNSSEDIRGKLKTIMEYLRLHQYII